MKKTLIALAAVAVSSAAMAQVTVSGKYAVAYTSTESAAGVKANGFGTTDGDVVFTAAEDIGAGMKAGASLAIKVRGRESAVTATSTAKDAAGVAYDGTITTTVSGASSSSSINGRDATVYLQGGFGRITLGTIEAGNGIIGRASAGAGIIGQDNGVTLDGAGNVDMMSLSLPIGAVTATVMLIDSIGNPTAGGMQGAAATQDATLVGLAYAAGPISAGVDHTAYGQNSVAAAAATDARTRMSVSYDLGVAKVGAGYQTKETVARVADKQMMFGVTVPMGAVTLGANYATRDNDNNALDASGYEVGGSYAFSKRTSLAAYYLSQELDAASSAATQLRVRLLHSF
jgi:predicted porin